MRQSKRKQEKARRLRERAIELEEEAQENMINELSDYLPPHVVNRMDMRAIRACLEEIDSAYNYPIEER